MFGRRLVRGVEADWQSAALSKAARRPSERGTDHRLLWSVVLGRGSSAGRATDDEKRSSVPRGGRTATFIPWQTAAHPGVGGVGFSFCLFSITSGVRFAVALFCSFQGWPVGVCGL
jgi:hypothetical protein